MAMFNSKLLVYQRVISLPLPDSCKNITNWSQGLRADLSMSIISMLMQRKRTCIRQMSYSVDNMWIISDCWKSVFSDSFSAICLHLESGLDRITRYSTIIPKHKHVSNNCNKKDNIVWGLALQPCAVDSIWALTAPKNGKPQTHASVLRSIRGDKSSRKKLCGIYATGR